MGQEFTSMCSCFDNQLENKQEIQLPKLANEEHHHHHHAFNNNNVSEIPGFNYEEISKNIEPATEAFLKLISEGIEGYDTIVDKENRKVYSKEATDGYILKYT